MDKKHGIHLMIYGITIILFGALVNSVTVMGYQIIIPNLYVVILGGILFAIAIWALVKKQI